MEKKIGMTSDEFMFNIFDLCADIYHSQKIKEGFIEPKSLLEWADLNYYEKCNPWISEEYVEKVHKFNSEFCPYVL